MFPLRLAARWTTSIVALLPFVLISSGSAQVSPPEPTPTPVPTSTPTPLPQPSPTPDVPADTPAVPQPAAGATPGSTPAPSPQAAPTPTATPKPKTVEQLTEGYDKIAGLFTIYKRVQKNKQEFLAEIPTSQIGPLFLLQSTFASGGGRVTSGRPARDLVWRFQESPDERLFVVTPNLWYRADDPALKQAIERDFPEAFLAALPILARSDERKTVLVDFDAFFNGSITALNDLLQPSGELGALLDSYALDANLSFVQRIRNFPENLVVEALYNYRRTREGKLGDDETLADPRSLPIRVVFNLYPLKQKSDYTPRLADPRLGYFINGQLSAGRTGFESLDDATRADPRVLYINRWNVSKDKPIVFYIDNSVPQRYRKAMREGILSWNAAFAPLGLPNAIQVRDAPAPNTPAADDYDHADMRFNTLRWVASPAGGRTYAVALLRENPLTGEIINASITVDANFARAAFREKLDVVNPISALPGHEAAAHVACDLSEAVVDPRFTDERYVDELLRALVAHEFGHILGLRHNFVASTFHSPEALTNPVKVQRDGVAASVMDYLGFNVFGLESGAPLFARGPGIYDRWAIQYGYAPLPNARTARAELPILRRIAARSGEPGLVYASDAEADFYDPTVARYDLSSDPLLYAGTSLQVTRRLLNDLDKNEPKDGDSYARFTRRLRGLIRIQGRDADIAARFIGGFQTRRVVVGNGGVRDQDRVPFAPLSLSQQRRALELVAREILRPNAVSVPREFFNLTAPDPFDFSDAGAQKAFPIRDDIAAMRAGVLRALLQPERLNRIVNGQYKFPAQMLGLTELFDSTRRAVWGQIEAKTTLDTLQRDLGAVHLETLIALATNKTQAPRDAELVARGELQTLQKQLRGPRQTSPDALTRLFFDDALRRIEIALERRPQS